MRETTVQEHIGDKLVDMKFAGQEEVKTQQTGQVDATAFEHKSCYERQDIHHQQILGHCRYIVHLCYLQLDN